MVDSSKTGQKPETPRKVSERRKKRSSTRATVPRSPAQAQAQLPVFKPANQQIGIVILLLILMLIIQTIGNPDVWKFVQGKMPLIKEGDTLLSSLTREAKIAGGWLIGALGLIGFTSIAPTPGLLIAIILFLLALFAHPKPILDFVRFTANLTVENKK